MKPVAPHPAAAAEFDAEVDYYERREVGLGSRFRECIEAAVERLRQHPKSFPMYEDTPCRECPVSVFPFAIYYVERDEFLWVLAFANQHRRPGYWLRRLRDKPSRLA